MGLRTPTLLLTVALIQMFCSLPDWCQRVQFVTMVTSAATSACGCRTCVVTASPLTEIMDLLFASADPGPAVELFTFCGGRVQLKDRTRTRTRTSTRLKKHQRQQLETTSTF